MNVNIARILSPILMLINSTLIGANINANILEPMLTLIALAY